MPQLAMPLFAQTMPVAASAVTAAWANLFPDGPRLETRKSDGTVDEYAVDGRVVFAAFMPAQVPIDEVVEAVRSSWMWQEPDDAVHRHRTHAIVTALGEDPLEAAWDVARVSAALLAAGEGVALYWGSSRQVHTAKVAIDLASESTTPPVPLFVGITISAESRKGPFSAATHGLEVLGHKEFEVRDSHTSIGNLRMTLIELAGYVLEQGPVLEDGQTFGPTAEDRWSISHEPSELVPDRDAIVLGIP